MNLRLTFSLGVLMLSGIWTQSHGRQLRYAFRKVEQAVVIVRTRQKEIGAFSPRRNGEFERLRIGVLISNDGKVLTAAHLVQAADRTVVEFSDGELIPARVAGSAIYADVALLQLDRTPMNIVPATLGNSDKLEVGTQYLLSAPLTVLVTLWVTSVESRTRQEK